MTTMVMTGKEIGGWEEDEEGCCWAGGNEVGGND